MARFAFLGAYQTNVELPDGSVVLVEPGDVVALDFDDPGPLWVGARTNAAKAAVMAAVSASAAKTPPAPADPAPAPAPEAPSPASGATPADLSTTNTAATDPAAPADTPPITTPAAPATPEENK